MRKTISLFLLIFLALSCKVSHQLNTQTQFYRLNENSAQSENQSIESLIEPYKAQLDAEMNKVIGNVSHELTKNQPESTLGNWFADLLLAQSELISGKKIDLAFVNYGGIRIPSVPPGPITKGKVFELMPFDNMVVIVYVEGNTMKKLLDKVAERGGWPVSAGTHFEIKESKAENIKIGNEPLDLQKTYAVSMSDYIANGGDNCDFLIDCKRDELGILLRDLIIKHIEEETAKGKSIHATIEGRITSLER